MFWRWCFCSAHGELCRITWWNVVDYSYHKESLPSGLFTKDMEPKPVYFALDRLINHEWKTRLTLKADADGKVSFRGFRGKYRLTWKTGEGRMMSRELDVR